MIKKKVLIIGAGISGLTAGIYALQQGFDVEIYESHSVPGGECTGWTRKGSYIDGCFHWIIGTSPKSELYPLWRNVGAFDKDTTIYNTDYLSAFKIGDKTLYFYTDLKKLEAELLEFFPEDKKLIKKIILAIKAYCHIRVPVRRPMDHMGPWSYTLFGLRMLPVLWAYSRYRKISMEDFASQAKNPDFRHILLNWLDGRYNAHSFFYVAECGARRDAGVIEGGSLKMALRMADRFTSLGGKLHLSAPVDHIEIEGEEAKGLILKDGSKVEADYVICTTDAYHAKTVLLQDRFKSKFFDEQFGNPSDHPLIAGELAAFRVKKDVSNQPKMLDFDVDIHWLNCHFTHLPIRNYSFDPTVNSPRGTLLTCLLPSEPDTYDILKGMSKENYQRAKEELLEAIAREIETEYGLEKGDVEPLDLTTPLTYERYCNAYRGSYMSFLTTTKAQGLMQKGVMKGVKRLFFAGQWLMPPGGLPIALFTGKHAAYRVAKAEHQKFKHEKLDD